MRTFLLAGLLTAGLSFSGFAQTTTPDTAPLAAVAPEQQPTFTPDPPRANTVLAMATATPVALPADLGAPLPADHQLPLSATARPQDGLSTARWILVVAGAALGLIVAITAAK